MQYFIFILLIIYQQVGGEITDSNIINYYNLIKVDKGDD